MDMYKKVTPQPNRDFDAKTLLITLQLDAYSLLHWIYILCRMQYINKINILQHVERVLPPFVDRA